jgi:hypothetical protein
MLSTRTKQHEGTIRRNAKRNRQRRCAPDRVKFTKLFSEIDYNLFQCDGQGERDLIYGHSSLGRLVVLLLFTE